jgi:DNA-binding LacI/PurR family transcriptional regulator
VTSTSDGAERRARRRITMEDIAREAGVSRALVSIAMRDAHGVSATTREHILEVARRLGYRHNRVAADLAGRGTGAIGVFVADLHNDLYADVFDGIREVLDGAGRRIVLTVGAADGSRDTAGLDGLLEARVGASIGLGVRLSDAELRERAPLGPLVTATREVPGMLSAAADDVAGAHLATSYLLDLGHRRIAFLANPPGDGYLGRRRGHEAAMEESGLAPRGHVTSYDTAVVRRDARELLAGPARPTAILAHNDRAAVAVLGALADLGLRCPEDVSVIGYDGAAAAGLPGIELSTIDGRALDVGRLAARIALAQVDAGGETAVAPGTTEEIEASDAVDAARSSETGPTGPTGPTGRIDPTDQTGPAAPIAPRLVVRRTTAAPATA